MEYDWSNFIVSNFCHCSWTNSSNIAQTDFLQRAQETTFRLAPFQYFWIMICLFLLLPSWASSCVWKFWKVWAHTLEQEHYTLFWKVGKLIKCLFLFAIYSKGNTYLFEDSVHKWTLIKILSEVSTQLKGKRAQATWKVNPQTKYLWLNPVVPRTMHDTSCCCPSPARASLCAAWFASPRTRLKSLIRRLPSNKFVFQCKSVSNVGAL